MDDAMFCVSVLCLLVTVLIGWQIWSYISVYRIVSKKVDKRLSEYDSIWKKKLAGQQAELLTAIMTTQIDIRNVDTAVLIASYIPQQMIYADAANEENACVEIEKIRKIIRIDETKVSKYTLLRLIESYKPLAYLGCVYSFLQELELMQKDDR